MALRLATVVNQMLEALVCLQSFYFVDRQSHNQSFALGNNYSGQLKDLTLQDMCCRTVHVDLESALCLTSI